MQTAQPDTKEPVTGPEAVLALLQKVDLDALEKSARDTLRAGTATKKAGAVALLNAIEGLRRNEVKPEQLMISRVPVLPPMFRPFSAAGGTFIPGDANELFRDLFDVRDGYKAARDNFGDDATGDDYLAMYDAVRAVFGHGEPVRPKTKERRVKGFIQALTGNSPKTGFVQHKLISKPVDAVSRATIIVDPDLSMDEIGIPEDHAWTSYAPHVQRRLVRSGFSMVSALKAVKDRDPHARRALEEEMRHRPVLYARAPAWHSVSVVGGWPKIVKGDMIAINPYVTVGLNADFDGDQINVHTPATDEAVEETKTKLMPSLQHRVFSIKNPDKVVPAPKQEHILSYATAMARPATKVHTFNTEEEAVAAIRANKVPYRDEVEILDTPDNTGLQNPMSGAQNAG